MEKKEEPKVQCNICTRMRELRDVPDLERGTCVYCLAEMGDPTAIKLVEEECRENGGYRGIDSVVICNIVKGENDSPEVESTQIDCDKCSRPLWVSLGTQRDVEAQAFLDGGKAIYLCFTCLPSSIMGYGIRLGENQKNEIKIAGFDVEQFMKITGMTLEEVAQKIIKMGITHDKEGGPHGKRF